MRWFVLIVLAGAAALALVYWAGWDDRSSPSTSEPNGTATTPTVDPEQLVRRTAAKSRPVESVLCADASDDLTLCVVTFAGPSCQLWQVVAGKVAALSLITEDISGSRSGNMLRCEQ
jgi:hypothetical protein